LYQHHKTYSLKNYSIYK